MQGTVTGRGRPGRVAEGESGRLIRYNVNGIEREEAALNG